MGLVKKHVCSILIDFGPPPLLSAFVRFEFAPLPRAYVLLSHHPTVIFESIFYLTIFKVREIQYIPEKSKSNTAMYKNKWDLACIVVKR